MTDQPQEVMITRKNLYQRGLRPCRWHYYTTGPDGTQFDNSSVVTLRQVLRQRYGTQLIINTAWAAGGGS